MAKLTVTATPIGNLGDLTPRAAEALKSADLILAEDTRVTAKLTAYLDIRKPMIPLHRHNEREKTDALIGRIFAEDLNTVLVCDAGTPCISDPGVFMVQAAWEAGLPVEALPGASAVVTSLSLCGFDTREFAFYGFLPREKADLKRKLDEIVSRGVAVNVFYESPHRVTELVGRIAEWYPAARLMVCCDLTKKFERVDRGTAAEVLGALQANANVEKGEYALVADFSDVEKPAEKNADLKSEYVMLDVLLDGGDLRAAKQAAADAGFAKNDVYRAALRLKELLEE